MTEPILTYSFDELSEEIQKQVIEKHWEINVFDDYWYKYTIDYWEEKLTDEFGLCKVEIEFDLHRRHETTFTGYVSDIDKFLNKLEIFDSDELENIHISFTKKDVDLSSFWMTSLKSLISDWREEICSKIFSDLQKEWDYCTSEEAITETLKNNNFRFTEKGQRLW